MELSELTNIGIDAFFSIASAALSFLVYRLNRWLGMKQDSLVRQYLNEAIERGIEYGKKEAKNRLAKVVSSAVSDTAVIDHLDKTDAAAISHSVDYVAAAVPGALKRFKISEDQLKKMIVSRM